MHALRVERPREAALLRPHAEVDAVLGVARQHGRGQHLVRVLVLRQRLGLLAAQALYRGIQLGAQVGRAASLGGVEVGHERRVDACAVGVRHADARHDLAAVADAHARQGGGEQEEAHAALLVVLDDLAQDGERRVVHHRAALRVLLALVVAARIERARHLRQVEPVLPVRPPQHAVVHLGRGVAVVRRPFRLELCRELLVCLASRHASPISRPIWSQACRRARKRPPRRTTLCLFPYSVAPIRTPPRPWP